MWELGDVFSRLWTDLLARPRGPFAFRFVLQPVMAAVFAVRDGIKDAKTGRSPYFWTVLRDPGQRGGRLVEGLKATGKIMAVGVAIDAVYQAEALGAFYPGEALGVALLLGFVPYLLIRGPAERMARRWIARAGRADATGAESRTGGR
jgi:hypothetical protein